MNHQTLVLLAASVVFKSSIPSSRLRNRQFNTFSFTLLTLKHISIVFWMQARQAATNYLAYNLQVQHCSHPRSHCNAS